MIKTFIRMLTPFIISLVDIVNGVMRYLEYKHDYKFDYRIYEIFSHGAGSSIILILYVLVTSIHMCKYYKSACWCLLILHLQTIAYLYIDLEFMWYLYIVWILSSLSLVFWTASLLGRKTYKTIHQACTREQTK